MFISNKNRFRYYYLYFTNPDTGKITRISTKTKLKTEALKFVSEYNQKLKEKSELKIHRGAVYIKDIETDILNYVKSNFTNSTLSIYRTALKHFGAEFGGVALNSITVKQVEDYKQKRLNSVNKTTCNIELRTLKAAFGLLVKWNFLSHNVFKDVKQLSTEEKERQSFTTDEINFIISNIPDDLIRHIVLFALCSGCRISEIINIQYRDINLRDRVLYIRNKDNFNTKTKKNREIPILDDLYDVIKSITGHEAESGNIINFINPDKYLFTLKGNVRMNRNYISIQFKKYLRSLGFNERFHFHCLRHTFITTLIKAGMNLNFVKEMAGHSDVKTTMNYIHITADDLSRAGKNVKFR